MDIKKIIKSDLLIFLFFLLIFFALFRYTESFTKGFDVVEDQLTIKTDESIHVKGFDSATNDLMKEDMNARKRFRPFWVVFYLFVVKMFGVNLLFINLFMAGICILTAYFLYKFCEQSGFTKLQSILFSFLTLIGPATIMYTRALDVEIIGMLMFSLSLYFISKSVYSEKRKIIYKILFVICLALTLLSKENFFITIPALLLIYLLFYSTKNNTGFWISVKNNIPIIFTTTMLAFTNLYLVIRTVGMEKNQGYAGVKGNLISVETIVGFLKLMLSTNLFWILMLGVFILLESSFVNNRFTRLKIKTRLKSILFILSFFVLLVLPQYIFYSKTGFEGRYYLPFLFGFSFTIIFVSKEIYNSNFISRFVKVLYTTAILVFLIIQLKTVTLPAFRSYVLECKTITEVLRDIKKSTGNDLLIVMDPVQNYPQIYTFKIYLDYLKTQKELKYDLIKRDYLHPHFADTVFYNKFLSFSNANLAPMQIDSSIQHSDVSNILILYSLEDKFLSKNRLWFEPKNYSRKQIGSYTFYHKI